MLTCQSIKQIDQIISSIPSDRDHLSLTKSLEPVCELISRLDRLTANAYVREKLKKRFRLTQDEVRDYQNLINSFRTELQVTTSSDKTDKPSPRVPSASFEGLVDVVETAERTAFLMNNNGSPELTDEVETCELTYVPPRKASLPFLLPQAEKVLEYYEHYYRMTAEAVDGDLYDSLLKYYRTYVELPHQGAYHLLVSWSFSTYLLESADYSPLILFQGTPGRGKTRAGKAMIYVAFRGMHIESLSAAHLIRATRDLGATLFVDVRDAVRKMTTQHSGDIILLRIERGAMVPRVLHPGRGAFEDTEFFPVFGATVLSSNEPIDEIVFGRTIPIQMPYTSRTFPMPTPEAGIALRERLVAFRVYHSGKQLPACDCPFVGRMGDISKNLIQMIRLAKPKYEPLLLEFLSRVEEQKNLQKLETLEARIIQAVCDLAGQVRNGRLPVKAIHERLNRGRDARSQIDSSLIGRKLGNLGFDKAKTSTGCIAMLWDTGLVQRVAAHYGLAPVPPDPPVASQRRSAVGFLKRMERGQ